jgi:hypothetical protein
MGRRHAGAVGDVVAAFYRPTTTVTVASPLDFAPRFTASGPVEMRLRSPVFDAPQRPGVAALYHREAAWSGEALLFSYRLAPQYEFDLQIPGSEQILAAAVEVPYRPSDKARQLRAVLARETSDQLQLYRRPTVLAVIEALVPNDSRQLGRVLSRVPEPDRDYVRAAAAAMRERIRTLDDLATDLGPLATAADAEAVADALNSLVDRGHVHRGFRADCSLCDIRELRQLHDAGPLPVCRACGATATYALGGRAEPGLFYRLSPVMRIISANGGLPVLAAAAVLLSEGSHLQPGAEANIDGVDFEVDILGWQGKQLFAGEIKRSAAGFRDVEGDVSNSARLGADVHVAATLDPVDASLRERLESACAVHDISLRVMGGPDLLIAD